MTDRAADVHALIEQECRVLNHGWPAGSRLTDYPNALGLIEAAMAAIESSLPDGFEHEGKTYRLRAFLRRVELGIYSDPSTAKPLLGLQTESVRWSGYRPPH